MKFFPVIYRRPTRHLWSQHEVIMLCEGQLGGLYFPNKIHLPASNHVAYTGDGVKHFLHFVIAEPLFLDVGH